MAEDIYKSENGVGGRAVGGDEELDGKGFEVAVFERGCGTFAAFQLAEIRADYVLCTAQNGGGTVRGEPDFVFREGEKAAGEMFDVGFHPVAVEFEAVGGFAGILG